MPQTNTHERLSPSASSRWLECPHSLRAPASPPSAASLEGDEGHEWCERVLLGECSLENVPRKFRASVQLYVEHVRANGVEPILERKWDSLEIEGYGGRIDCLLVSSPTLVVYDFKFGKWPVEAEGNTQLLCYADLSREHFSADTFYGVIVQPRAKSGPKVKVAEFNQEQVDAHRERVKVAAVSDHKKTGDHCRFCTLRTTGQCVEGITYGVWAGW